MATKNQTTDIPSGEEQVVPLENEQVVPPEADQLVPLEELRRLHQIALPIFAGVCSANEWHSGRAITEGEFLAAVKKFTGTPISGMPVSESEAKA